MVQTARKCSQSTPRPTLRPAAALLIGSARCFRATVNSHAARLTTSSKHDRSASAGGEALRTREHSPRSARWRPLRFAEPCERPGRDVGGRSTRAGPRLRPHLAAQPHLLKQARQRSTSLNCRILGPGRHVCGLVSWERPHEPTRFGTFHVKRCWVPTPALSHAEIRTVAKPSAGREVEPDGAGEEFVSRTGDVCTLSFLLEHPSIELIKRR